jgi:hypothetical protein
VLRRKVLFAMATFSAARSLTTSSTTDSAAFSGCSARIAVVSGTCELMQMQKIGIAVVQQREDRKPQHRQHVRREARRPE